MNHRKLNNFLTRSFTLLGLGIVAISLTGCGRGAPRGPIAEGKAVAEIRSQFMTAVQTGTGGGNTATAGTGWAKLSGVVKLAGDAPAEKPLDITKEQGVCAPGGAAVFARTLVVDPATKALSNVVIYARKAPRVHDSAKAIAPDVAIFDQKGCLFTSRIVAVQVKQKVSLTNSDTIGHNIHFADNCASGSLNVSVQGGTAAPYSPTAQDSAPFAINCDIHPWMKAYMMARKDGYFSVTKADGSFEIANLPAGEELEFQIWHERMESPNADVGGVKIAKGRFKLKLAENEDKKLTVELPVAGLSAQ